MARLSMEWIPDEEEYSERFAMREIDDDADIDEMFGAWKEFMGFMGYYIEDFYLIKEDEIIENINVPEQNSITAEDVNDAIEHSYKS